MLEGLVVPIVMCLCLAQKQKGVADAMIEALLNILQEVIPEVFFEEGVGEIVRWSASFYQCPRRS
jgi:hypothetical protein